MNLFQKDIWLGDVLERTCAKIDCTENNFNLQSEDLVGSSFDFVWMKVPCNRIDICNKATSSGFFLVDTNIQLIADLGGNNNSNLNFAQSDILIENATQNMEKEVCDIAKSCFNQTRFHKDPNIDVGIANQLKGLWVKNFFYGNRGDLLLVAKSKSRNSILGFLLLMKIKSEETWIIDLIGVSPNVQNSGIGSKLIQYACQTYPRPKRWKVGTQLSNFASIRFYEKLGFKVSAADHVYHWHRKL